ncbi:MAG: aspartate--tRNA ligase, partial [Candidatus Omnitrophota bacterium]
RDFVDIETPILTKSTPEGARDYLVPSRLNVGKFFALPQSPQLFKQILMVSGFDRYYQIAKCFRDEDLRADRQPEFTQLDIEMSFVEEKDIFDLIEGLMSRIFKETIGYDLKVPFDVMTHKESMQIYGTDKPDRRFGLELVDLTDLLQGSGFKVFSQAVKDGGIIKGLNLKQPKQMSRSRIDALTDFVRKQGMGGLAYFKVEKGPALSGPIVKFFSDNEQAKIIETMSAEDGDLLLIVAGEKSLSNETLARLRNKLGCEEELIKGNEFDFLWVVEFPLFQFNADDNRWESEHHPFTAPFDEDMHYFDSGQLDKIRSRSYDLVVNGNEISSGSIRIHSQDVQKKIFDAIGITPEEADLKFSFLIEALSFGAPPHGGIAPGLDRLVALLAGCDSIREVIAFPKTQKAICSMTKAPSAVSELQLKELGLEISEE